MMERMNNADFHKFLTEFSNAVAQGKYKKMPYDKYRELRKIKDVSVDIYVSTYTDYNEERISRIIVAPYGPVVYEFDMHDGSFGNFCYDYLKKKEEPKVHPNEKKQYDIYGNLTTEDYYDYQTKCDKIDNVAKEAYYDYCAAKATGDSLNATSASCVMSNDTDAAKAGINWYYESISNPDITPITATLATPSYVETKTMVDILQEDVEGLKKLVEDNNCEIATKANISEVNRDIDALGDAIGKTNMRIDECEYDLRERIEEARTAAIEESWYTRAELEQLLDKRIKELEEKYMFAIPADKLITQSTSSNCYPVKNFKLNVGDTPCSDDRKEKENMDTNKMFNFDFGPVASHIRMSPYGMAMKNADGKYVSYDRNSGNIVDVEIFNFDAQKFLYKMPVAVNAVTVGDIVVHMRKAMFVSAVNGNRISVVDIYNGEVKDIMPTTSPFGFNFITKVVSLIDMSGANAETPFGNMLPFLLMGDNKDNDNSMLMMAMAMSGGMNANMMSNPLMLMAMMDGKADTGMLMYLAMQNQIANMNNNNCNHENNSENHQ